MPAQLCASPSAPGTPRGRLGLKRPAAPQTVRARRGRVLHYDTLIAFSAKLRRPPFLLVSHSHPLGAAAASHALPTLHETGMEKEAPSVTISSVRATMPSSRAMTHTASTLLLPLRGKKKGARGGESAWGWDVWGGGVRENGAAARAHSASQVASPPQHTLTRQWPRPGASRAQSCPPWRAAPAAPCPPRATAARPRPPPTRSAPPPPRAPPLRWAPRQSARRWA